MSAWENTHIIHVTCNTTSSVTAAMCHRATVLVDKSNTMQDIQLS